MINFPQLEKEILEFWKREKIFQKTLAKKSPRGTFVFIEGPPTANGRPGIHHVLTRAFKDIVLRFKTMRGFYIPRKAGWDTHGLPVELEVEKKLGISGKKQIENLVPGDTHASIIKFNKLCRESVWTYLRDWEEMTDRVGFWLDLENPYITYKNSYIETLWWIIKKIYDRGLLYEDYKIVPYCPRCGTTLSSHEVALGYKDDTPDPSIYLKFQISGFRFQNTNTKTYFLVWTTTPWTLPGNVALAVGKDVTYVRIKIEAKPRVAPMAIGTAEVSPQPEEWILAKNRLSVITEPYEIIEELKGNDLEGIKYTPLFLFDISFRSKNKADFEVYTAPFISTEDGTGIVHIAPAFGEEDNALGKEKGLSLLLTVDGDGKVNVDVPGKGKFVKEADKDITQDLRARGLLYRSETIKHTYPFCWRCDTPLLYYAKISWWIKMSELRNQLIKNNEQVNWVPTHLKEGRFGEWLRGVKDWAFSRERYWGTPLPIWKCDKCKNVRAVGSLDDFPRSKNNYLVMRHGETNANTGRIVTSRLNAPYNLTDTGKKKVADSALTLKKRRIDFIISSDFPRTRETAEIVSQKLNVKVEYDPRLREMDFGDYEGLPVAQYHQKFTGGALERFQKPAPNGETLRQVLSRQVSLINELEKKYQGKNILFVGHGDPLWVLEAAYLGHDPQGMIAWANTNNNYIHPGEVHELKVRNLPQDDDGFVDLHRPYVDQIIFDCDKCSPPAGGLMHRLTDVCDVWFDSGAAPFAQHHFPFEDATKKLSAKSYPLRQPGFAEGLRRGESSSEASKLKAKQFPADFITEAIDQTRGWFYTLLATSTLLGYKVPPYKNVISVGHVLDTQGQKMSKSRGNVIKPEDVLEKFGADALRLYFYTSSQPGDPKKFDIKGVDEILKKTLLILWNVFEFYRLYADKKVSGFRFQVLGQKNVLDKWILANLNLLIKNVTAHLDKYEITEAGRALQEFITDLSTWYIRRSRERFKTSPPSVIPSEARNLITKQDKQAALATLTHVLEVTCKLLAPFTPFISERIYQDLSKRNFDKKEVSLRQSVHLANWPHVDKKLINQKLLDEMETARRVASLVLEERARVSIAVRQPLSNLNIKNSSLNNDFLALIKDEVNVKNINQTAGKGVLEIVLDTTITPELRLEGLKRELVRQINALRKEAGLTIRDFVDLFYETGSAELQKVFQKFTTDLCQDTLTKTITSDHGAADFEKNLEISDNKIWMGLKKS